jgi:hypothetical protein
MNFFVHVWSVLVPSPICFFEEKEKKKREKSKNVMTGLPVDGRK